MRIARLTALAALAALAITASMGAGSALAVETTLCKTNAASPYCAPSDRYAASTTLEASSGKATISEEGTGSFECSESALKGQTGAQSGEPLPVSFDWTLGGCVNYNSLGGGAVNCTATSADSYSAALSWTSSANGTLAVTEATGTWDSWFFNCGNGSYLCTYEYNANPTLTFEGGSKAKISVQETEQELLLSGAAGQGSQNCPSEGSLGANHTVDAPTPAYVAQDAPLHTRLCKANESPCQLSNSYPAGTTIEAEAPKLEIATPIGKIVCGKTTMSAKTQALAAEPLPLENVSFSISDCAYPGAGSCTVTSSGSTGTISYGGAFGTPGLLLAVSWKFDCGSTVTCTLGLSEAPAQLTNGNPATFKWNEMDLSEEGNLCQDIHELSATFTITSPTPFYAT